ncbi:hypothetical protein P7K49_010072, partial [Saguinus oedipus]
SKDAGETKAHALQGSTTVTGGHPAACSCALSRPAPPRPQLGLFLTRLPNRPVGALCK